MARFLAFAASVAFLVGCGGTTATQSVLSPLGTLAQHTGAFSPTACPASPTGSGILPDGDFSQASQPPGYGYFGAPAGTKFAPSWIVTGQTIDFLGLGNPFWAFPNGLCNVDLDGTPGPGGITHSLFETKRGKAYTVSFILSGNGACFPIVKKMVVGIGTSQSRLFTWNVSNHNDAQNGRFAQETWHFEARHRKTLLHFESLDPPGNCGAVVGGISVTRTR
jgi:uncharacterized protein DUF642